MTLDDLRRLDPKNIGNWPLGPKLGALVVLLVLIVFLSYWFDWQTQMEELEAHRAKEAQLRQTFLDKKKQAINLDAYRKQLGDIREWGQPLATLYASEGAIYRRYGYGPASLSGGIAISRESTSFYASPPSTGRTRMVTADEALELFPPVYDRLAAETPGMLSRSRDWWETRRLATGPWAKGELFKIVLEIDGRPEGYALYLSCLRTL